MYLAISGNYTIPAYLLNILNILNVTCVRDILEGMGPKVSNIKNYNFGP